MGIEELPDLEIFNGIFTLLFVVVSIIVGLRILLKYFAYRRTELITVGFTWIGMCTPWIGNSLSFLLYVTIEYKLELVPYLFLENAFIAIAIMSWIYSFSKLVYPKSVKKLTLLSAVFCIPYELYLLIMLIINPEMIGTLGGYFDCHHTILPKILKIVAIFVILITGIIFANASIKAPDPNIKWKGRFFLIGIVSFTIGALLDTVLTFTPLDLVLVRLLLVSSSIEYYLGFFLPESIAKKLIKNN